MGSDKMKDYQTSYQTSFFDIKKHPSSETSAQFLLTAMELTNAHPRRNLIIENGGSTYVEGCAHVCANPGFLNIVGHKKVARG
jgi:hypothetical protein